MANQAIKADRSLSIQEQFGRNNTYTAIGPLFSSFGHWYSKGRNAIPRYGDSGRDAVLARVWMQEPILAGAINTIVKRMKATGYNIEGGRNNAVRWARKLQAVNDGRGWQDFIARWVQDYLTTDLGAIIELGLDSEDRPQSLYNMDSLKCSPWLDHEYPMLYVQPTGRIVKLPRRGVIHLSDMTSPREELLGRGFCAVSRVWRAAETIVAIYDYEMQKLGKLPPLAAASIQGITQQQFIDSWEQYKQQREKDNLDVFPSIFWIGGDDPNVPITITITDFASLPEQFERAAMIEMWVKTIALNLGVDVGELWLIQHVGATKASQSVQHQKALGKGTGEIHAMLEMALNVRVLPADVTFTFDFQDDEQDRQRAEILLTKINNLMALYTQSSRGPAGQGGIAAPFSRSGAGQVTEPGAQPQTTGTIDITPPLITRDQAIDLGTRWGVFPPGFFGQEVTTVAGMILKEAGLLTEENYVIVTHDMKVYQPNLEFKRKQHIETAKLLLSRLKEAGAETLLHDNERQALEFLSSF
jgi:hypothetical protein